MFDLFVSLGWYCATASSLQSHGLRDISGPFDWCQTHLEGVIHFLETEFEDFLARENCEFVARKDDKVFYDRKWGVLFPHEIRSDFEEEWVDVQGKYDRRVQRLRECLQKKRICFVRAVRTQDEIAYIVKKQQHIKRVIENKNSGNAIIFLIPQYMYIPVSFPFPYYMLKINVYQMRYYAGLRDLFGTVPDFVRYCQDNYDNSKLKKNLMFDLEKEKKIHGEYIPDIQIEKRAMEDIDAAYGEIRKLTSQCKRLKLIAAANFEKYVFPLKMIIYGAGDIGKLFYDKIIDKTSVYCFVDANPKESSYDGVEISKPEDCKVENNTTVLITCDYDFNIIVEELQSLWRSSGLKYVRIEDILK